MNTKVFLFHVKNYASLVFVMQCLIRELNQLLRDNMTKARINNNQNQYQQCKNEKMTMAKA